MSDRLDELAMRRRALLLRSERLRADLAADQRVLLDAISGIDRIYSTARRAAPPLLMLGAGALLLRLFRRSRGPAGRTGFAMKALFWVSMCRKALPYVTLAKNLWQSRARRRDDEAAYNSPP
jgi:hypothetical protein